MNAIGIGSRFAGWTTTLVLGILLTACGGGGGGGGSVQEDISVGITTQGSATTVPSGGTLGMVAQVNNAANREVTWSLAGPSCPASCGSLTSSPGGGATYAAPSGVTAQFTVTVTATSVQNPARSASVTLTVQARVCPAGTPLLDGPYAFLLQGFEVSGREGVAAVGSFTADGCGNVTGGEADYYFGPALVGHTTSLSGTYTIGADQRGKVDLTVGAVGKTFAVALGRLDGGVATRGGIVEMGTPASTVVAGSLWRQEPSAFTLGAISGPYAFVLDGWNGAGPREAMGGTVRADGAGRLTDGLLDVKRFGSAPAVGTAWTGSHGTPSGSGRTVLAATPLTGASGTGVLYVVDAGHLIALISDATAPGRVLGGSLLAQTGPFGLGSLSGRSVAFQTANYDQPGYTMMTTSVLTMVSADGAGHVTLSVDANAGGNVTSASGIAYTYAVTPDGHASLYAGGSTLGGEWYLTAPNTALMLGFDTGGSIGRILPQADGPFTAASISGSYFATQAPGGAYGSTLASGVATSSGGGTLSTTMDVNMHGAALWGEAASGPVEVDAAGRATDTSGNVIYVVSPTTFFRTSIDRANYYPVVEVFER